MRAQVEGDGPSPGAFRAALLAVPADQRDAWLDAVLDVDTPEDGPELPPGCVPYLPCEVDALLAALRWASVGADDVVVDVGVGSGRAAAALHLLSGAAVIGVEVQPKLAAAARALAARALRGRLTVVEGDAAQVVGQLATGTVFFFYCPFSGERLEQVLSALEVLARARRLHVCCVGMAALDRAWLERVSPPDAAADVYRSR